MNIDFIKRKMKEKHNSEKEDDITAVIVLLGLERKGIISSEDIIPILKYVFDNDVVRIMVAMKKAEKMVDEKDISDLINDI